MAYPSDSARTKTWVTEVLTAADLDGQFDIIHDWINAALDGTTGHGHTGGTNDGKQLDLTVAVTGVLDETNGGTGQSTIIQGDVLYGSAANTLSTLPAGTAGQALTTNGAAANPSFAGMTTYGDVEYRDSTGRQRLAAGTSGQFLQTQGASAAPQWVNGFASVLDYGTSTSSSTQRGSVSATLKICYGVCTDGASLTNLPFTSSSTYSIVASIQSASIQTQDMQITAKSASGATISDGLGNGNSISWFAIGT